MQNLVEPTFIDPCEISHMSRGGKGFSVARNIMDNWWKLGVLI